MVAFFITTTTITINNQRLWFKIRSVPGTTISANLQGSMILMLSFQEHAKLIPLNTGYENLKTHFPVVTFWVRNFQSKLHSSVWKKNLFIKKNLFHMQSTILYSLGFAFNLVLFFVITIIKTYIENIATERHPCNRKVFLVIKLPQNEIF